MQHKICFIGAGNLATHLSYELQKQGHRIVQVYSRTNGSAKALANLVKAKYTTSPKEITNEASLYFVALKDSVVPQVLNQIDFKNKPVIHCSGSLPLSILETYSANIGVLYPLQTFSKSRKINFRKIPVFIEANTEELSNVLLDIGHSISGQVTILNSEKRKSLHISAVFACNFVNHMYSLAGNFLESKDIPFEVLKPLIEETANKIQELRPKEAQTGPAVRFDENIINNHLAQLNDFPMQKELYNSISKSIFEFHQEKNK